MQQPPIPYLMPISSLLPPSDAEVYARQLFEKCYGYPLWCPEPYGSSRAYRSKGVSVGDVGYVTRSGGFETLFNICLEADDPSNYNGVPPGFQRLVIPEARLNIVPFQHQRNSRIVNGKNVGRSIGLGAGATDPVTQLIGASASIQYTWRTAEGAILHLPNGATRVDSPPGLFLNYIKRHALNWDMFINETLQCNLPPGSIYLVTSCDKTDEWMLGSFHQESAGREVSLEISTLGLIEGHASFAYHWDRTSPLVCRDYARNIEATPGNPTASQSTGTQCVFLQGFRVTVRKKRMSRKTHIDVDPIEDSPPQELGGRPKGFLSRSASSNGGASWTITREGDSSPSTTKHMASQAVSAPHYPASTSSASESVSIEDIVALPLDWHPSVEWNEWLLDKYPDATVAFTHDEDIPHLNSLHQSPHSIQQVEGAIGEEESAFWSFPQARILSNACEDPQFQNSPDLLNDAINMHSASPTNRQHELPEDSEHQGKPEVAQCVRCREANVNCDSDSQRCERCRVMKVKCSRLHPSSNIGRPSSEERPNSTSRIPSQHSLDRKPSEHIFDDDSDLDAVEVPTNQGGRRKALKTSYRRLKHALPPLLDRAAEHIRTVGRTRIQGRRTSQRSLSPSSYMDK